MVLQLIREWLLGRKLAKAAAEGSSGERCIACDSTDVTMLAPAAYCCNECDHEGGDGYAAYKRAKRNASFEAMPTADRRTGARDDLIEARRLLVSAIGDLTRAAHASGFDMAGMGGGLGEGGGGEKQSAFISATGLLHEARNVIDDAKAKLGTRVDGEMPAAEGGNDYLVWSADIYFDNIFTDIQFHTKIAKVSADANRVLEAVNNTLQAEFGITDVT
ncbi:MAG: hypothetical protein JRF63_01815 [Deltaproteobacteria bacterium]|nr:hypothetical protein [Deltaproteobacteria bacterium]